MIDPMPPQALPLCQLPTYGRAERAAFYEWKVAEEHYAEEKFSKDYNQRATEHDDSLRETGLDGWWYRQITQYLDRAESFYDGARELTRALNNLKALSLASPEGQYDTVERIAHMEGQRAKLLALAGQAVAKCTMTAQGAVESHVRVFGALPPGGAPSGYLEGPEG